MEPYTRKDFRVISEGRSPISTGNEKPGTPKKRAPSAQIVMNGVTRHILQFKDNIYRDRVGNKYDMSN